MWAFNHIYSGGLRSIFIFFYIVINGLLKVDITIGLGALCFKPIQLMRNDLHECY